MNIVYCTSCGHKIEYTYPSPKFCPSCGTSMSGEPQSSQASNIEKESIEVQEKIPSISKLEYEIDSSNANRIIRGSDIDKVPESPRRKISSNQSDSTDLIKEGMQRSRKSKTQTDIDG